MLCLCGFELFSRWVPLSIWENKCDVTNTAAVVTYCKDVMTSDNLQGIPMCTKITLSNDLQSAVACVASVSSRVIVICSRPNFLDELARKRLICRLNLQVHFFQNMTQVL